MDKYLALTTFESKDPIKVAIIDGDDSVEMQKQMGAFTNSTDEFLVIMHVNSVAGQKGGISALQRIQSKCMAH